MTLHLFTLKKGWPDDKIREHLAGRDAKRVRHWYAQTAAHLAELPGVTPDDQAALRALADALLERLGVIP